MTTPSDLRSQFEFKLNNEGVPEPPGCFHPEDLKKLEDDDYLRRFINHCDGDLKASLDMLWNAFLWRKTSGANDINESNIRMDYVNEGAFFPHGRDVDGSRLIIFKCNTHTKGSKDFEELKKCIIYWFDRVEREEKGNPITLFFDMEGCGLGNIDLEFIKYLISLVKSYYPYFLNYIIIYEMPWILNAPFKVIKQLLPARGVARMKFVNKTTLKEFVEPDQALTSWGGTDEYQFKFIPEQKSSESSPEHAATTKKVSFFDGKQGNLITLTPPEEIVFKTEKGETNGTFTLKNTSNYEVLFKIRTTAPEKFRVRPYAGALACGASLPINITLQPAYRIGKDRFLVLAMKKPVAELSNDEMKELWKNEAMEYRLKCLSNDIPTANGHTDNIDSPHKNLISMQIGADTNSMRYKLENMQAEVKFLKIVNVCIMFLSTVSIIISGLIYLRLNETDSSIN